MKKRIKRIIVVGLTVFTLIGANMSVFAAGCGNWAVDSASKTTYCSLTTGCGLLGLYHTNYQDVKYVRTCVSNLNVVTIEYKTEALKLGCCN